MADGRNLVTSVHPASPSELDTLKTYRKTQNDSGGPSGSAAFRAEPPKYATMPFSGVDMKSEWVTVAGALSTPVFLYVSEAGETLNVFAARLSAACKLPVLAVSYATLAEGRSEKAVENILSVFKALLNARIPATQIVLAARANAAPLALSALLRLADSNQPLPRCALAISPAIGAESASESMPANRAGTCPLLVIAADDELGKDDSVQFAERASLGTRPATTADRRAQRAASAGIETTLSLYAGMPRDV